MGAFDTIYSAIIAEDSKYTICGQHIGRSRGRSGFSYLIFPKAHIVLAYVIDRILLLPGGISLAECSIPGLPG